MNEPLNPDDQEPDDPDATRAHGPDDLKFEKEDGNADSGREPDATIDQPQNLDANQQDQFGATPTKRGENSESSDSRSEIAGRKFKLIEQIGEGGMGAVWRAQQSRPVRREVAIKLIRKGTDSKSVVARFDAERQALAIMDHPNIARVLDGGVTKSGQPYFVMELVRGLPLTEYCDQKRLTIKQRLELFVQICSAVQHAHQKGIIHRDLKPGNILVMEIDNKPVPKVIDFGLAKALGSSSMLTEQTLNTAYGMVIGTPLYMAPEQMDAGTLDIDTRADVYALGVILYELLTGSTPIDRKRMKEAAWEEVRRIVREEEPLRPSSRLSSVDTLPSVAATRHAEPASLHRLVRGDLDWIVMKSLEKDRNRRYETANGFAADVQRYLTGEPVFAAPPSTGYRVKKFLQKHRAPVIAASLVAATLVAGIIGTTWFAFSADIARKDAIEQKIKVGEEAEKARLAKDAALAEADRATRAEKLSEEEAEKARNAEEDANTKAAEAIAAKKQTEATLARSDYFAANSHWNDNRVAEALGLLHRIPEEYRNIEWNLDRRLFEGSDLTLYGHHKFVTCVAFSPDGTKIASGSVDHTIRIWDSRTGEQISIGNQHDVVTCLTFTADGMQLASGSFYGKIWMWDVETGKKLYEDRQFSVERHVHSISFSPDGLRMTSASDLGAVDVWSLIDGNKTKTFSARGGLRPYESIGACFSSDGKYVAWGCTTNFDEGKSVPTERDIRIIDLGSGKEVARISTEMLATRLAISPAGKYLAYSCDDYKIRLWDLRRHEEVGVLSGHSNAISSIAFSNDGALIASTSDDRTIRIWDVRSKSQIGVKAGHFSTVTGLSFSPDGSRVASGSADQTVKVWNLRDYLKSTFSNDINNWWSLGLASSPDGKVIVSGGSRNKSIKIWDGKFGFPIADLVGHEWTVDCIDIGHDSNSIVSGSRGTIKHWSLAEEIVAESANLRLPSRFSRIHSIKFNPKGNYVIAGGGFSSAFLLNLDPQHFSPDILVNLVNEEKIGGSIRSIAFSPDGAMIATGETGSAKDFLLRIWDADSGIQRNALVGHQEGVTQVEFSPDGEVIASGSLDKTVRLWSLKTCTEIFTLFGHNNRVTGVAFTPNGTRLVSSSLDNSIKIWETSTGDLLRTLQGETGRVHGVVVSPDGSRLVSGGDDGEIQIWDASKRDELRLLRQQPDSVECVVIGRTGTRILSGTSRGEIVVWDRAVGDAILTLPAHSFGVSALAFSPNESSFVSGCQDGSIKVWETLTGKLVHSLPGNEASVRSLGFSSDGEQFMSRNSSGETKVWSALSGRQMENAEREWSFDVQSTSQDGRWHVIPIGKNVGLVDQEFKNSIDEKEFRAFKAKLDPKWHRQRASIAEGESDWFAAAFHWAWVLKSDPELPEAYDGLHVAYDKWRKESLRNQNAKLTVDPVAEKTSNYSETEGENAANAQEPAPDSWLSPIILEMLKVQRGTKGLHNQIVLSNPNASQSHSRLVYRGLKLPAGEYAFECLVPKDCIFAEEDKLPEFFVGWRNFSTDCGVGRLRYKSEQGDWIRCYCTVNIPEEKTFNLKLGIWSRKETAFANISLKSQVDKREFLPHDSIEQIKDWTAESGSIEIRRIEDQ